MAKTWKKVAIRMAMVILANNHRPLHQRANKQVLDKEEGEEEEYVRKEKVVEMGCRLQGQQHRAT
jgi:hypothetical protein